MTNYAPAASCNWAKMFVSNVSGMAHHSPACIDALCSALTTTSTRMGLVTGLSTGSYPFMCRRLLRATGRLRDKERALHAKDATHETRVHMRQSHLHHRDPAWWERNDPFEGIAYMRGRH